MKLIKGKVDGWDYEFEDIFLSFQSYSENLEEGIKEYYVDNLLYGYGLDEGDKYYYV